MAVDMLCSKPNYEQIYERLQKLIVHGVLEPQELLPSVYDMAKELSVSPYAVELAYRMLLEEGFISKSESEKEGEYQVGENKKIDALKRMMFEGKVKGLMRQAESLGIEQQEMIQMITGGFAND